MVGDLDFPVSLCLSDQVARTWIVGDRGQNPKSGIRELVEQVVADQNLIDVIPVNVGVSVICPIIGSGRSVVDFAPKSRPDWIIEAGVLVVLGKSVFLNQTLHLHRAEAIGKDHAIIERVQVKVTDNDCSGMFLIALSFPNRPSEWAASAFRSARSS